METPINIINEETESLQAEKVEVLPKKKRVATEKQLEGMKKGREKLQKKHKQNKEKNMLEEEEKKKRVRK